MTKITVPEIGILDVSILPNGYIFLEGKSYNKFGVAHGFKNIKELKHYFSLFITVV